MSKTLWSAEFSSRNSSFGSGVVIMDGNQITGGGEKYYYIGNCSLNGNTSSASVSIKQHVPGSSIFGPVSEFTLLLTGCINGDNITLSGYVEENDNYKINATMRKLANLA